MSKHNYSQYSKRDGKNYNNSKQTATNGKSDEVKMEVEHGEKALDRANVEKALTDMIETVEAACPPKTVEGVVANCAKLNVRSKPSITGEVLCVLNVSSEIEIDVEKSVPEWFYICTATGIEGYCMRQFVDAHL